MGIRSILCALTLSACVDSSAVPCGGGLCPEGTKCAIVTNPDATLCVDKAQVDACIGLDANDACATATDGTVTDRCYDGVCLPAGCGNGRVDPKAFETCDDGNTLIGDGCAADCLSTEKCGDGFFDPLRTDANGTLVLNETCDDGNPYGHDGCARCAIETPHWVEIRHGVPDARHGPGMAYNRTAGGVVMFGGLHATMLTAVDPLGDMWLWDGLGWTDLAPVFAPSARAYPAMAQDTKRDRIVLFGGTTGSNGGSLGDTWEWDGSNWQFRQLATNSARPDPRAHAGMAYDADDARMILFGGLSPNVTTGGLFTPAHAVTLSEHNDTWEWDGQAWHEIVVNTPPPVQGGCAMAYDPSRGVVVMIGIEDGFAGYRTVVWEYDDDVWKEVTTTVSPPPRIDASLSYDPNLRRLVLHGGTDATTGAALNDTWALDGATGDWTDLSANGPPVRSGQGVATDPIRKRLVLFGGHDPQVTGELGDTMEWNGQLWAVQSNPTPDAPKHAGAYDARRGRIVTFGDNSAPRAVWELVGGSWVMFPATASSPSERDSYAMAYDAARDLTVLYGGDTGPSDTFLWNGATWTTGLPGPARLDHAMAYDPVRREIVMFGGRPNGPGTLPLAETWIWNGTTWSLRTPATQSPSARADHVLAFDEFRKTVVMFGGRDKNDLILDETWEWNGADWKKLTTAGSPQGRRDAALAWNPARRRLVLFGGHLSDQPLVTFGDTWEFDGASDPPQWNAITTPVAPPKRTRHILAPSADGTGVVVVGGSPKHDDIWRLRWDGPVIYETCRDANDADGDLALGCADTDCWSVCDPFCPPTSDAPSCATSRPRCGDGICIPFLESCAVCPADCACSVVCGDSVCAPPETAASCPGDC